MSSACLSALALLLASGGFMQASTLRVCADPNNLPFSNDRGEGIENRLAATVARDLGMQVEYVWWPQRGSFVSKTLGSNRCDLLTGIPSGMPDALTTVPYYTSTYVFVQRSDSPARVSSLFDAGLRQMRIGVHITGDDYAPPAIALGRQGLAANIKGYSLIGAPADVPPPAHLIHAVARGEVDIAIAWGPLAGYFAKRSGVPLTLTPVTPASYLGVPFTYSIAMGVREGNTGLRQALNGVLARQCSVIQSLLSEFGFPAAGASPIISGDVEPAAESAGKEETGCASAAPRSSALLR